MVVTSRLVNLLVLVVACNCHDNSSALLLCIARGEVTKLGLDPGLDLECLKYLRLQQFFVPSDTTACSYCLMNTCICR